MARKGMCVSLIRGAVVCYLTVVLLAMGLFWALAGVGLVQGMGYPVPTPLLVASEAVSTLLIRTLAPGVRLMCYPRDSGCAVSASPVHVLASIGAYDGVSALLSTGYFDVNTQDSGGATALHYAAVWSRYQTAITLAMNGADLGAQDVHGETPVQTAQRVGSHRIARALEYFSQDYVAQREEAVGARSSWHLEPIDRHHFSALSPEAFVRDYASLGRPVIIEGMTDVMTPGIQGVANVRNAMFETLRKTCGDKEATLKVHVPEGRASYAWASMLDYEEPVNVSRFIDAHTGVGPAEDVAAFGDAHLFDWGLRQKCPALLEALAFTVPSFASRDALQTVDQHQVPCGRCMFWPSLFIQAPGTRSGLHVDARFTQFWQLLVAGSKEWVVFPESEHPLLGVVADSPTFHFALDAFHPSMPPAQQQPLSVLANGFTARTEPGDWIFIPAHSAHQVRNLEASVALSANYVDENNIADYADTLRDAMGESSGLFQHMRTLTFDTDRKDTPWSAFASPYTHDELTQRWNKAPLPVNWLERCGVLIQDLQEWVGTKLALH